MGKAFGKALESIRERSEWALAAEADSFSPDSHDSPGARFLRGVRGDFLEALEWAVSHEGLEPREAVESLQDSTWHEIADGAVPVYTHDIWKTFVDLGAYQHDGAAVLLEERGDVSLTYQAQTSLYAVAYELVGALIHECEEALDKDEEAGDEGDECECPGDGLMGHVGGCPARP